MVRIGSLVCLGILHRSAPRGPAKFGKAEADVSRTWTCNEAEARKEELGMVEERQEEYVGGSREMLSEESVLLLLW